MLPDPHGVLSGGTPPGGRLLDGAAERDGRIAINLGDTLRGRHLALYLRVIAIR
jgi:hypothetical protein